MKRSTLWAITCAILSLIGGGSYAFLTNVLLATPCSEYCDADDNTFRKPWYATFVVIASNALTNLLGVCAIWMSGMLFRGSFREAQKHHATPTATALTQLDDVVRFANAPGTKVNSALGDDDHVTLFSAEDTSGVSSTYHTTEVDTRPVDSVSIDTSSSVPSPPGVAGTAVLPAPTMNQEYSPIFTRKMALPLFYIALFDVATVFLQVRVSPNTPQKRNSRDITLIICLRPLSCSPRRHSIYLRLSTRPCGLHFSWSLHSWGDC